MIGPWCWKDRSLVPLEQGVIPVDDINFAYGYGVYETLKVRHGKVFFAPKHEERLFHSAALIGLEHYLESGDLIRGCQVLVEENQLVDSNLKVLLIGGRTKADCQFWIMALPPLFPDRKNYRDGALALSFEGERNYPGAKSLNMLVSTLAYRKAQSEGAYDALLVNRSGEITEGTRTNFFWTDGTKVFTPPEDQVLAGVTRWTLLKTLEREGILWEEKPCPLAVLDTAAGCFLTSTSTKVMPLNRIDEKSIPLSPLVTKIQKAYDRYLEDYQKTYPELPS